MLITNFSSAPWPAWRPAPCPLIPGALLLLTAFLVGCAHTPKYDGTSAGDVRPAPLPPLFLNGPMALLLTNLHGFRAHVQLESGSPPQTTPMATGELTSQGCKLLFAPAPTGGSKKRVRPEDSAFIWDVNENRGYVLNDPLQGYAPVSSSHQFTNVVPVATADNATPDKIDGHPCQKTDVTITAADGTSTLYHVWRARDLPGIPLRINCPSGGLPVTFNLSKVRLETLPPDSFQPPSGFTKYESPEAMMAELFLRKHNLSRKTLYPTDDNESGAGRNYQAPTRPN